MRAAESSQPGTAISGKPLLIYDGNCGFCKLWIARWKRMTGGRIAYAPSQEVGARYPQITREQFAKAVYLVRPDGSFASGAEAVFESLGREKLYRRIPLLAPVSEAVYRFIAAHRDWFYRPSLWLLGGSS